MWSFKLEEMAELFTNYMCIMLKHIWQVYIIAIGNVKDMQRWCLKLGMQGFECEITLSGIFRQYKWN